jgi:4'-phosphopantetheinyl transferase
MLEVYAIHTLPKKDFEPYIPALMDLLPPDSAAGVLRFRREKDQQRSLLGEVMSRIRLSSLTGVPPRDISIHRKEKGKPVLKHLPGYHFNVSHSGDWVVTAISDREVGIDVERLRDPQYRIAERFFSEEELGMLNSLEGADKASCFFDLWTLKESYLKLLGKGLTQSLGSFTLRKTGDQYSLVINGTSKPLVHFKQYPLDPDYKLSVCYLALDANGLFERLTVADLYKRIKAW